MHIRAKSHMVSRPVNRPGDLTRPKTVRDRSKTSLSVNHAEKAIKKKSTKHASKHARALPTHALESIDPALTRKVSGPSSRVDHHPVNMPLTAQNVFSIHTEAYMFLESVNPDLAESQILFTSAAKQAGPRSLRSGYMVASIECDIKLPPAYVDLKHHAVIYSRLRLNTAKRERGVFIIDRSIKGTWLNGKRLVENEETELNEGDIVSFRGENGENEISYVVHLPKLKNSLFTSIKDRYTIKKYIENGSFGEVSKARCNVTRRIVALKKFYTCNPNQKKYLKQEISTYLSLRDHPCIIRLEEVLEYNDDFYLVMEFGEDGDLFQYVSNLKVPLSEDEVKIIFDQIFYAVESLHDQGVAHRDLKLENILVMSKKTLQIKLADFGLAKFESERNFTTMCGTKSYVAPEILYEPRSYDKSVDIWSLGVMLYCTIARKFPFDKLSPEILWSLQKAPERFFTDICFDGISRECKDLIIKLLTPDSTKRPTIKDVLKHPWLEHIETQRTELKGLQRCPELMDYIRQREASGILSPALTP